MAQFYSLTTQVIFICIDSIQHVTQADSKTIDLNQLMNQLLSRVQKAPPCLGAPQISMPVTSTVTITDPV